MIRFVAIRVGQGLLLMALMSVVAFVAIYALGNPIASLVNPEAPPEVIAKLVSDLGLDRPFYEQYLRFVRNALQGNFGSSYLTGQPALGLILERFPATLELTLTAMAIGALVGIPLGVYAGYRPQSLVGRASTGLSVAVISLPSFWFALALIIVFSINLNILPTGGRGELGTLFGWRSSFASWDGLRHIVLPALNLSLFPMALFLRLSRDGVQETLGAPFIRFARAKGISERRILFVYVLRHILVPIVTVLGLVMGSLLAFSVVTESIFSWPGGGKLVIEAIRNSDRPIVVAYLLFTVTIFIVMNTVVDVVCALVDPRISV